MAGAATLFAEGGWLQGRLVFAPAIPSIATIVTCGCPLWLRGLDERVGVPCERLL
jgi:hypothetical protein